MKFELMEKDAVGTRVGPHYVGNRRFKSGDVVESSKPLDKLFKNKFRQVPDNTPLSPPEILDRRDRGVPPIPVPVVDVKGVAKPPQATPKSTRVEVENIEPSNPVPPQDNEVEQPVGEPHPEYGKNVTHKFVEAQNAKLQVFFDGTKYRVVDPASGSAISKRISSKERVASFLNSYLE